MTGLPLQTSRRCCSDLTLDRLVNDDLPRADADALHAHLEGAPLCRARYDELFADRAAFRARLAARGAPKAAGANDAASTTSAPASAPVPAPAPVPFVRRFAPALAGAAAIAASLGLVTISDRGPTPTSPPIDAVHDDVRAKGSAVSVDVWATTAGTSRRLAADATATAGDVLALHVVSAQPGFAAAIVADDEAQVSLTPAAVDVTAGADLALGEAITLDVSGGDVRFAVVVCADRGAVGPALRGVSVSGAAVETSGSCTVVRRVVPRAAAGSPQP
jgi:hypothetical protein